MQSLVSPQNSGATLCKGLNQIHTVGLVQQQSSKVPTPKPATIQGPKEHRLNHMSHMESNPAAEKVRVTWHLKEYEYVQCYFSKPNKK